MSDTDEGAAGNQRLDREAIVARLFAALDRKLREIEERMAGTEFKQSTADSERDARMLTTLARLLEKIGNLDGGAGSKNGKGTASKEIDADHLRRSIADRLEGMLKTGGD